MKTYLVGLAVGMCASISTAQIPMSKYVRTYTFSHTRGYYFQAPTDFTVTELQVPDESNRGSYVVALYRMSSEPPAYPTTTAVTPVFYAFVKDAHACAKVPATAGAFKKGDWCAVLGGAGTETGNLSNSYGDQGGAANNASAILGVPIANNLRRCGMQINMGTGRGAGNIFNFPAEIGRVKMTVASGSRRGATSCDFCPPSAGAAALDVCSTHPAIIGKNLRLNMRSGGTANTGALLAYGFVRGNIPVPGFGRICITGIGGILPYGSGSIPSTATGKTLDVGLIPAATPAGVTFVFQGALQTAGGPIPLTNGLELRTGL